MLLEKMPEKQQITIALCRHFPYDIYSDWKLYTSKQYNNWIDWSEKAKPFIIKNRINPKWEICYTSPIPRAKYTALQLCRKNIIIEEKNLIEIPFKKFHFPMIMPKFFWQVLSRIFWFLGIHCPESRKLTKIRAKKVINKILNSNKSIILIISHGFFMNYLANELKKNNFKGEIPKTPEYGKIYYFKKNLT